MECVTDCGRPGKRGIRGIKDEYSTMLQSSSDLLTIFFTATTQEHFIRIGVFPRTVFPPARTVQEFFLPSWCLHEMSGIGLSIVAEEACYAGGGGGDVLKERRQKWA